VDDGFPSGNGNVLRERIAWLRHRIRGLETGTKYLAELGAKANEQIRVHDEQFHELERRLSAVESAVSDVPVLRERLDTAIDQMRSIRTALYSAAGGLALVAAAVVFSP
jgi:chromosome segregation ATPase